MSSSALASLAVENALLSCNVAGLTFRGTDRLTAFAVVPLMVAAAIENVMTF